MRTVVCVVWLLLLIPSTAAPVDSSGEDDEIKRREHPFYPVNLPPYPLTRPRLQRGQRHIFGSVPGFPGGQPGAGARLEEDFADPHPGNPSVNRS